MGEGSRLEMDDRLTTGRCRSEGRSKMRGHLTRRCKNSWRSKNNVPSNGKRVTNWVTSHANKKQAAAEAAKILASVAGGTHVDPTTATMAEIIERWLREEADINVGSASYVKYAQLLRGQVTARIGSLPIQKLTGAHLKQIYADMARNGLSDPTRLPVHPPLP